MKTGSELSKIGMIGVIALLFMAACGKKDDGGGAAAQSAPIVANVCAGQVNGAFVGGQQCQNGLPIAAGTTAILNNVQLQNDHLQGTLSLMGGGGNINLADPLVPVYYVGPVTFTGTVTILDNSYCGAPAQASSAVTGTANYFKGAMNSINFLAGPLRLMGNSAVLTNPSGLFRDAPGTRISFLNAQLIVNNQPCGLISTY